MRRLAEIDRLKLVGLLADRLAFERAAAIRYGEILTRLADAEPAVQRIVPRLEQQLADERAQAAWLERELQRLEAPIDRVRAHVERTQVDCDALFGDRGSTVVELVRSLHRLELGDVAAWELLTAVAARADDEPARRAFSAIADGERAHLAFVERVAVELAVNDALGWPVTLPIAP